MRVPLVPKAEQKTRPAEDDEEEEGEGLGIIRCDEESDQENYRRGT